MANIEKDFRAQVLTNKQLTDNVSDDTKIKEGDLLLLIDKGIPIPADKVGTADSVDKDKVPIVQPDGTYTLAATGQTTIDYEEWS